VQAPVSDAHLRRDEYFKRAGHNPFDPDTVGCHYDPNTRNVPGVRGIMVVRVGIRGSQRKTKQRHSWSQRQQHRQEAERHRDTQKDTEIETETNLEPGRQTFTYTHRHTHTHTHTHTEQTAKATHRGTIGGGSRITYLKLGSDRLTS
jgi:hypothetical protein